MRGFISAKREFMLAERWFVLAERWFMLVKHGFMLLCARVGGKPSVRSCGENSLRGISPPLKGRGWGWGL